MHEYTSKVRIWELTCPGLVEEVGRARRWARDILHDHPQADDAALIVSELTSNAVVHTASGNEGDDFLVTVAISPSSVCISVADSGHTDTCPHVQHPDDHETRGRGLTLVTALADYVEVHGDDTYGHVITAEFRNGALAGIPHPAGPTGTRTC